MSIYVNRPRYRNHLARCFLCSRLIADDGDLIVSWWGRVDTDQPVDIELHPECAGRLAMHLIKDSMYAQYPRLPSPLPAFDYLEVLRREEIDEHQEAGPAHRPRPRRVAAQRRRPATG